MIIRLFETWRTVISSPLSEDAAMQRLRQRLPTRFAFLSGGPAAGVVSGATFKIARSGVMPAQLLQVQLTGTVRDDGNGSSITCVSSMDRPKLVLACLALAIAAVLLVSVLIGWFAEPSNWPGALIALAFASLINLSLWVRFLLELRRTKRDWTFLTSLVSDWLENQAREGVI